MAHVHYSVQSGNGNVGERVSELLCAPHFCKSLIVESLKLFQFDSHVVILKNLLWPSARNTYLRSKHRLLPTATDANIALLIKSFSN